MAFAGDNWKNVDPTNKFPYTYNFKDRLAQGDTIAAVTWKLEAAPNGVYRGKDATPMNRISGSSSTNTTATTWLDGLVAGVRYRLTAFVTTANGVHDDLWAFVSCDPAP